MHKLVIENMPGAGRYGKSMDIPLINTHNLLFGKS